MASPGRLADEPQTLSLLKQSSFPTVMLHTGGFWTSQGSEKEILVRFQITHLFFFLTLSPQVPHFSPNSGISPLLIAPSWAPVSFAALQPHGQIPSCLFSKLPAPFLHYFSLNCKFSPWHNFLLSSKNCFLDYLSLGVTDSG